MGARVYPRTCGGTGIEQVEANKEAGLSPHVRGNQMKTSLSLA